MNPLPAVTENETPESITAWSDATFGGDVSPLACAVRANLEMAELLAAVTNGEPVERIAEECADVSIVLWRLLRLLKAELDVQTLIPYDYANPTACALGANTGLADLMSSMHRTGFHATYGLLFTLRCLHSLTVLCGFDLQAAINAKMQVNRVRKWRRDGTGCGYHIKTDA